MILSNPTECLYAIDAYEELLWECGLTTQEAHRLRGGTIYSRVYTNTVLTRVKYNPGQNNPGYICVASTHNIQHARARHCDGGKPSRNRYFKGKLELAQLSLINIHV